ncbi:MAG: helix-turn-helix domain-containing protein [Fibrobacterota bacterium]|nr:AraC family transcriptional regulator [Chitinispirillaceae bacterium]
MDNKTLLKIRKLVGPITEQQMQYVECSVHSTMGIFIPSVGQCGYAITPQHTHPAYSVLIAFDELSPVFPKGLKIRREQYGCTLMSPNIPHEEEACENFTRFAVLMIQRPAFESVWKIYSKKPCGPFFWTPFAISRSVMPSVKQFMAECSDSKPGKKEVLDSLELFLSHMVVRALCSICVDVDTVTERLDIQRSVEYIHAHFGDDLSIDSLARDAHCSVSHFSRIFKRELGYSPKDYLIKTRIDKSRKLLQDSADTITDIAYTCGFATSAHFSDSFKKITGVSPSEYRKSFS